MQTGYEAQWCRVGSWCSEKGDGKGGEGGGVNRLWVQTGGQTI